MRRAGDTHSGGASIGFPTSLCRWLKLTILSRALRAHRWGIYRGRGSHLISLGSYYPGVSDRQAGTKWTVFRASCREERERWAGFQEEESHAEPGLTRQYSKWLSGNSEPFPGLGATISMAEPTRCLPPQVSSVADCGGPGWGNVGGKSQINRAVGVAPRVASIVKPVRSTPLAISDVWIDHYYYATALP